MAQSQRRNKNTVYVKNWFYETTMRFSWVTMFHNIKLWNEVRDNAGAQLALFNFKCSPNLTDLR